MGPAARAGRRRGAAQLAVGVRDELPAGPRHLSDEPVRPARRGLPARPHRSGRLCGDRTEDGIRRRGDGLPATDAARRAPVGGRGARCLVRAVRLVGPGGHVQPDVAGRSRRPAAAVPGRGVGADGAAPGGGAAGRGGAVDRELLYGLYGDARGGTGAGGAAGDRVARPRGGGPGAAAGRRDSGARDRARRARAASRLPRHETRLPRLDPAVRPRRLARCPGPAASGHVRILHPRALPGHRNPAAGLRARLPEVRAAPRAVGLGGAGGGRGPVLAVGADPSALARVRDPQRKSVPADVRPGRNPRDRRLDLRVVPLAGVARPARRGRGPGGGRRRGGLQRSRHPMDVSAVRRRSAGGGGRARAGTAGSRAERAGARTRVVRRSRRASAGRGTGRTGRRHDRVRRPATPRAARRLRALGRTAERPGRGGGPGRRLAALPHRSGPRADHRQRSAGGRRPGRRVLQQPHPGCPDPHRAVPRRWLDLTRARRPEPRQSGHRRHLLGRGAPAYAPRSAPAVERAGRPAPDGDPGAGAAAGDRTRTGVRGAAGVRALAVPESGEAARRLRLRGAADDVAERGGGPGPGDGGAEDGGPEGRSTGPGSTGPGSFGPGSFVLPGGGRGHLHPDRRLPGRS